MKKLSTSFLLLTVSVITMIPCFISAVVGDIAETTGGEVQKELTRAEQKRAHYIEKRIKIREKQCEKMKKGGASERSMREVEERLQKLRNDQEGIRKSGCWSWIG